MCEADKTLISVILCFYNEEKFIEEAIASVLAQDYNQWELLLVDDGSSDRSTAIAKEYAFRYPEKIKYLQHPGHCNEGLSASRNLGIEKAKGDYVAFIDADDVWFEDKLDFQLKALSRTGATVMLEASVLWNSWRSASEPDEIVLVGMPEGIYQPPKLMLSLYPLGKGAAPCLSGMMVHRAVLSRYVFEESFRGIYQMYEDQTFLCKVYLKEVIFVSAACHNKHRRRITQMVSSVSEHKKYHQVRNHFLYWFNSYIKNQRIPFKRVRALVREARMPYSEPLKYKFMIDYPRMLKVMATNVLMKFGLLGPGNPERL